MKPYPAGNKYSGANRIYQLIFNDLIATTADDSSIKDFPIKAGITLDYFGGLMVEGFAAASPDVYRANVDHLRASISMNFTFGFQFEIVDLF